MSDNGDTTATISRDASSDTVARLASQRSKFRAAAKNLTAKNEAMAAEIATLKEQVIEAAKTGGAAEIAELKATIRNNAHRGKFNELARAAGVKDKALEDLWNHSGYKADGDEPDEAKITAAIKKQQVDRDYLFDADSSADQGGGPGEPPEPEHEPARPGPGRGQGGTRKSSGSQFRATQEQLADPAWCMANEAKLQAIAKEVANMPISQVASRFLIE